MSVEVMGYVWRSDLPSNERLVALAYADHANDDGGDIFPSIARIANKTGYSERQVQRLTRALQEKGILVEDGKFYPDPERRDIALNRWRMDVNALARGGEGEERGDNLTPRSQNGVTNATDRGDTHVTQTVIEPSDKTYSVQDSQKTGGEENLPLFSDNHSSSPGSHVQHEKHVNARARKAQADDWRAAYRRFIRLYGELFPEKPTPQESTQSYQRKFETRYKADHFRQYWEEALRKAADSVAVQEASWFHVKWFLQNDEHYQRCLAEWMAWKDEKILAERRQTRLQDATHIEQGPLWGPDTDDQEPIQPPE